MYTNKKFYIFLFILISWLGFIFLDAFDHKDISSSISLFEGILKKDGQPKNDFSLGKKSTVFTSSDLTFSDISEDVLSGSSSAKMIADNNNFVQQDMKRKIQNQKSNIQDIKTLEYIYQQEKTPNILKEIIKKQAQNYNFNEAWNNIQKLEGSGETVDIQLFLHVYLNSNNLSITQAESITKLIPILNLALQEGRIMEHDYQFYAGLIEIWNKNYSKAMDHWKDISEPQYIGVIQGFKKAMESYDPTKAIPAYYQDGLVALAALKNGYFTLARKIALETIFQDDNYILPYQILSYAHFLTDNRDTAIDYFLKLSNFDKNNIEMYQFLIGVSYYRKKDYPSSIIYLSQNKSEKYRTDTLRYLVVDYMAIDDYPKALEYRQQLLGQPDIKSSDFFYYFYNAFYKEYVSKEHSIYKANKQLATLFIDQCGVVLGAEDNVCIYGKIGEEIVTNTVSSLSQTQLIALSETYNQSYFYHILGDLFARKSGIDEAKKWYAKTIATSQDAEEIKIIQEKLSSLE